MRHEPDLSVGVSAALDELEQKFDATQNRIIAAITKCNSPTQVQPQAPIHTNRGGNTSANKIRKELMPDRLSNDATAAEMRFWAKEFRSFYRTSCLDKEKVEDQQLYFFKCIDMELDAILRLSVDDQTPVLGDVNSCMAYLKEHFEVTHPVTTRRIEFFRCKQKKGQKFTAWLATLVKLGQEAELDKLTVDDIYVHNVIEGTVDLELQKRFLKLEKPTLADIKNTATAYEIECLTI